MTMPEQPTYYEKQLRRLKDRPVFAWMAIITLVVGVGLALLNQLLDFQSAIRPHRTQAPGLDKANNSILVGNELAKEGRRQISEPSIQTGDGRRADETVRAQIAASTESFSTVTFEDYVHNAMNYISAQTDLQRTEYIKAHQGKRVIWTGPVYGVRDSFPTGLSVSIGHDGRFAWCEFSSSDKAELLKLRMGDIVEVTGVIGSWEVSYVELNDARLLRILGNEFDNEKKKAAQPARAADGEPSSTRSKAPASSDQSQLRDENG